MDKLSLAAPLSHLAPQPRQSNDSHASILVVDDDAALRMLLERHLTAFGYTPLLAIDGEDALNIARTIPGIRLVILDLVMPGISGKLLAEQLTVLLPDAQMLYCSGHPASALARLGLDIPGAQFMQKPCRPLELKQRLSDMLALRQATNCSGAADVVASSSAICCA